MSQQIEAACKNCQTTLVGPYCHQCGRDQHLHRIDAHFIWHEMSHVLHLEKGIFYTIRELSLRPSKTIRTFLDEDRHRLVKPLLFLILCSLLYNLVDYVWPMPHSNTPSVALTTETKIWAWVAGHFGYANFLMSIPIAICLRAVFWRQRYNVFEIWVMLAYIMGLVMLFLSIFPPLRALNLPFPHLTDIIRVLSLLFVTLALAACFDGPRWWSIVKTAVAYVLGMFLFSGMVFVAGWMIDHLH
ncbi:DUF3667 domain-containing protein [Undibacterium cyanobacteriorum]|uniref:DUF3667 domain-containing protein n=1 Tax=Undibacterium cyanobacteriorum TaxID=3073561 RepID=A0ABY9RI65_9BURK|nr:DUF3667 domain-containing protein [Undibacterium sp. 20NA77.5]WMW80554.1 DUF3667 domain-containing protein [Undibacterium sp. 20NA77.5]